MQVLLTPDQAGDNPQLLPLVEASGSPVSARAGHGCGPGRMRIPRPGTRQRRVWFVQSRSANQTAHRAAMCSRGRAATMVFATIAYKRRNVVERCSQPARTASGLAARYARRATYVQTELAQAALVLWLR